MIMGMGSVCMVCAGNICRSPMAAVVLRSKLMDAGETDVVVESAGTGGWHVGDPADSRARAVLDAHEYDGSQHRAQQFNADWFDRFDLVLALDSQNLADLRSLSAGAHDHKIKLFRSFDPAADPDDQDVPDPYYGRADGFEDVLTMVERAADGLVAQLVHDQR